MVGRSVLPLSASSLAPAADGQRAMTGTSNKGVYFRDGIAYIRYQDERGGAVRESTKQRSGKVAQDILPKRKSEVAVRVHFPTRAFDAVTFTELANYWWQAHGSKTRSQFRVPLPASAGATVLELSEMLAGSTGLVPSDAPKPRHLPENVEPDKNRAKRGNWRGRRDSNPRPPA